MVSSPLLSSNLLSINVFEIQSRFCLKKFVDFWKTSRLGEMCHYHMHIFSFGRKIRIFFFHYTLHLALKFCSVLLSTEKLP